MPGRHRKPRPTKRRAATVTGLTGLIGAGLAADPAFAAATATTMHASLPGVAGGSVIGTATVTGRTGNEASTVVFTLYAPADMTCSNAIATVNVPIPDNHDTVSTTPVPVQTAGIYRWVAAFQPDANDTGSSSACNAADSTVEVAPATATVTTGASPGFVIGAQPGTITDTATVAGANPTGSVVFRLYGPDDTNCSGTAVFTSNPVNLMGGQAVSPPYAPQLAGAYRWVVSYSGDANNAAVAGACNAVGENVTILKATPAIATTAGADLANGTLTDSATVSNRVLPQQTGSVTFKAYPPTDPTCAGQPIFTSTKPLPADPNATTVSSDPFAPAATGTYRWIATYSGDANNVSVSGACGDATETTAVSGVGPPNLPPPPGVTCLGETATIVRGPGDDEIQGTSGRDVIVAGGGDDIVYGRGGADVICGGPGNDAIAGGNGGDEILGEDGSDTIFGENGSDQINGGDDDDELHGNDGDDLLTGGPGQDHCFGGDGSDIISSCL